MAALAAAGAIAAIALLKPWLLTLFYSAAFRPAAGYLRWTLLGDYLKVTSWILVHSDPGGRRHEDVSGGGSGGLWRVCVGGRGTRSRSDGGLERGGGLCGDVRRTPVAVRDLFVAQVALCSQSQRGGGLGGRAVPGDGGLGSDVEADVKISVAIATYNRAAMARQAVEAALAQSRAPDEIVVADDASTDDTGQVLDRLSTCDARVRVIRQPVNSGGVANWNAAMAATRGDLIAWCSDDDRFLPGHLEASAGVSRSPSGDRPGAFGLCRRLGRSDGNGGGSGVCCGPSGRW